MAEILDKTIEHVSDIQNFDPQTLVRSDDLGRDIAFTKAVEPAQKFINFFRQIPINSLIELPESNIRSINDHSNQVMDYFNQILQFSVSQSSNPIADRDNLIAALEAYYISTFAALYPLIAYLGTRERDVSAIEAELRGIVQTAKVESESLNSALLENKAEAERIVSEARSAAAEQGVGFEAQHFKTVADEHLKEAAKWQKYTVLTAIGLGAYAILLFAIALCPTLNPESPYQAAQLALSKALLFAVIAYMLVLCVRNLMAHRHNAVVNTHRQNALLTYQAMANATHGEAQRDVVIMNAASCIYSPQETGYTKGQQGQGIPPQLVEVLPKIVTASQ